MKIRYWLKRIFFFIIALLAACGSKIDSVLFSLVSHPQEPEERHYNIRKVEFENPNDGTKLSGELTYPTHGKRFPAFVLVSGHIGGEPPAGRNYEITGHKYFLVISHLLTLRGYAVFRYDNRGVGESNGQYVNASDDEFAADAAAALGWLRKQSGIPLIASGFLGHSQGGVKSLIAAKQELPDYIVSLAGIGIETMAQTVIRQTREVNEATGVRQSITNRQTKELEDLFEILRLAKNRDEANRRIRQYAIDGGVTDEAKIQRILDEFASVWSFAESHREIEPLIRNFDGPILALFGSKDLLVSASVNENPTQELLQHPFSQSYTFQGLNHLFQVTKKGTGPEEYWEIETTIEENVIEKIDAWTKAVLSKQEP